MVAAFFIWGATTSTANAATDFGFNDSFGALESRGFDTGRGATVARFPVNLGLPNADAAYQTALSAGVTPIMGGAGWGKGPATVEAYAASMADMARRFPQAIYQLWNEPNLGSTACGPPGSASPTKSSADAAAYAVAGARAVREINPDAQIIGPSIAPVDSWQSYFKQMYRKIPRGLMGVGLNLYPIGLHRKAQVEKLFKMARQFGPVDVTELDMAAPWSGSAGVTDPGTMNIKARKQLHAMGAKIVLMNQTAQLVKGEGSRTSGVWVWDIPAPCGCL